MVITPFKKVSIRPGGKSGEVAPVAPVVLYVMSVIGVFTQTVWLSVPGAEVSVMVVLLGCTMMVPVAVVTPPQPPVKVTV